MSVFRRGRVAFNRFDYIQSYEPTSEPLAVEPGGISPLARRQPKVPNSRATKERAACAAHYVKTAVDLQSPPVPMRAKVSWPQTRAKSPLLLTTAKSRMQMLSEGRANG